MRFSPLTPTGSAAALFVLLVGSARAQQFQQVTNFPDGTGNYSEGVECADVDNDGDLDIIVADGDGAASGASRQNRLYVNKTIETGVGYSLVDESVARFGANLSNAKGVTTGDVNGDGWVDVLFSNSNNQAPSLYINQGAANPGFFTLESAARGFTVGYNSGSAVFADLDNDGDLDVIMNDGFNGASRQCHLYVNNGSGFFTENAAALASPFRSAQMNVQLADMDNDWDIDFLGFTKMATAGGSHYLMLNSGSGSFTDSSSLVTPASGATYEGDVADLDGDNDLDMFFISLTGFREGAVRNNLVGLGTFTFTNQTALTPAVDDNEVAFFDYDNDGDYDVLIGSLSTREYIYRNDGNLVFTEVGASTIQAVGDSSLNCTVGDLNNDGKYEIITVQGESGSFINKFYKNTGAADTLAPVITGTNSPASAPSGSSVVVRAKVRDQVLDDGVNYVRASGDYVITSVVHTANVSINAGAFAPNSLTIPAGTTVTWTNASGGNQNVVSTTTPYTYNSGTVANAGTYARTFVKPGTYTYTSSLGGFNGTIVVTGTSSAAVATYSGGQMYRFRMDDTAGGTGVQLAYELRFKDWPGNTRVSDSVVIPLTGASGFAAYCRGDGGGLACPCGNDAPSGSLTGCLNSLAVGGQLQGSGVASLTNDTLVASGTSMPNGPCLYYQGNNVTGGGLGVTFGDGLRCAAGGVIRLGVKINAGGASQYPAAGDPSLSVKGFVGAPGTRYLQIWYRDSAAFCQPETFNLTNGLSVVWTP